MSETWKVRLAVGVGLVVLVVPAVIVLQMSDSAFRDRCKAQCTPYGLTYRVTTTGSGMTYGNETYPANCYCIRPDQRTVVEKLRDLIL
jgi:hypothetical protein